MTTIRALGVLVLLLLMCQIAYADDREQARTAVMAIRQSIVDENYETLYDEQVSQWLKQRVQRTAFIESMRQGRLNVGAIKQQKDLTSYYASEDPASGYKGEIYSFDFLSTYERGSFHERIVVIKEPDGLFRLSGLFSSPAQAAGAGGDKPVEDPDVELEGPEDPRATGAGGVPNGWIHAMGSGMPAWQSKYAVMPVHFATDRNRTVTAGKTMFGTERGGISYGTCTVSIPRDHRMGKLESPSIWKFEIREDPEKHVVLLDTKVEGKEEFFSRIADRVRKSKGKNTFLFIHGYNVSFEDAARRTAQMAYDLGFDGAPVFYSWPSRAKTSAYFVDQQTIEWSQVNLQRFLEDYLTLSQSKNVYLIAHSMGNQALTRAVSAIIAEHPSIRPRLREIILTAPDIDVGVFTRDIAPALVKGGRPVTLYASSDDEALKVSNKLHGKPRAGDAGDGLVIINGIETIDATGMDTSLLGHSYYGESRSVLSDMFYVLRSGSRADERFGLIRKDTPRGRYWIFKR